MVGYRHVDDGVSVELFLRTVVMDTEVQPRKVDEILQSREHIPKETTHDGTWSVLTACTTSLTGVPGQSHRATEQSRGNLSGTRTLFLH